MNIDSAFPSAYLKASDIPPGKSVVVEIDRVDLEDLGEGESKPVIRFRGKDKGLVLNRTNAESLKMLFGVDTEDWEGHQIRLVVMPTTFMGKPTQGIRVDLQRPPDAGLREQPAGDDAGDDDIPF